MSTFRFRLSTLLRLRENVRDDCRQQLAAAQRAEQFIVERIAQLDDEMAAIGRQSQQARLPGPINVDRLLDAGRYQMTLLAELQSARAQREQVAAEVDRRREALVEADREVKTLEKLREQQHARHRYEQNRREIKQLDAMAIGLAATMEDA